jgi:hypothetical protein
VNNEALSIMKTRLHNYWFFLLVSMVGAFITAFTFIAAIYFSLPPTDLAYGQGFLNTLGDPFVLTIALPVALVSGLLASPLLFFGLRRKRLSVVLPIIFISVLTSVVVLTPFSALAGLVGAFFMSICSVVTCMMLPNTARETTATAP